MKKTGLIIAIIIGILVALSVAQKPGDDVHDVDIVTVPQVSVGDTVFDVEIADSYWERVRGLSGRDFLAPKTGLLFIFSDSDSHGIWMKDMNFAIDIVWANENFEIVGLARNASPNSYPNVFYPEGSAKYVLEVPTNAIGDNVKIGDKIIYYPQQ